MSRRDVRTWVSLLTLTTVVCACGSSGQSATDTAPAPVASSGSTATTWVPATTSTIAPASAGTSTTTSTPAATVTVAPDTSGVPASSGCAFTGPVAAGEITWIENGQLHATDGFGSDSCLLDDASSTASPVWSPSGDRVVLDGATVAGADGSQSTGFAAASSVSWSQPTGKALISVDPQSHRLIWRSATSSYTQDISFLARTDEAVYHPAGTAIAAVGVDENGMYGIWLASNRGEGRRVVTTIDDPSTPAHDLAFSSDGRTLFFIHGVAHALSMQGLQLSELGVEGRTESDLTVSAIDWQAAIRTGECDSSGSVVLVAGSNQTDLRTLFGSPFKTAQTLQPLGWIGSERLVVLARDSGCAGPGDVWTWSPTAGFDQIGTNWSSVTVRIAHGPFQDLPANIDEAAPG